MLSRLSLLKGWRRVVVCVLLGAVAALGHPPFFILVAPFFTFSIWLFILSSAEQESLKQHFLLGWSFGLGYFTVGLYWITFSLGVDLSLFWWLIPFSLFGIPICLSIYIGFLTVLLKLINVSGFARCCTFAVLWALAELAWSNGPLALPWNPLGLIWAGTKPVIQSVSIFGINGLTLITALAVSIPQLYFEKKIVRYEKFCVGVFVICLFSIGIYGALRENFTPLKDSENLPLVRLVQPNIPQKMSWEPESAREQFYALIELSSQGSGKKPDLIIWPESALPIFLEETPFARQVIAEILSSNGYLIAGTVRRVYDLFDQVKVWNSLVIINKQAKVIEAYDKKHLVPFGEYIPFRQILPSQITKITAGAIDYSRGDGVRTIEIDSYPPFSPLICFESIFTAEVVDRAHLIKPEWLLNITNDAWFGRSSGPYQHLQLARLRAIEEGIPLVRVANTGISTVVDSFGNEVARLGLNEIGVLDVVLPAALAKPTFFVHYGNLIYSIMIIFVMGLGIISRRNKGIVLCHC